MHRGTRESWTRNFLPGAIREPKKKRETCHENSSETRLKSRGKHDGYPVGHEFANFLQVRGQINCVDIGTITVLNIYARKQMDFDAAEL